MPNPSNGRPIGRPAKPIETQRMLGNPGHKALPAISLVMSRITETPHPTRPLGTYGADLWVRTWEAGKYWLNAVSDIETIMVLCEQTDERIDLRERVLRFGDWRERTALRMLEARIMAGLHALGMTPEARARIGIGVQVGEVDPLDELRRARG